MKNKEITVYELIGLDDEKPKKIKIKENIYELIGNRYYLDKKFLVDNDLLYKVAIGHISLHDTVGILSEENDELEDIKYYEIEGSPDTLKISHDYLRNIKCTMVEGLLAETINQIIKNQKYLKERLDKNEQRNN